MCLNSLFAFSAKTKTFPYSTVVDAHTEYK